MDDDEIKINLEPDVFHTNLGEIHGSVFSSLNDKLPPLFENQELITGQLGVINDMFANSLVVSAENLSSMLKPVMDTVQSLNLNLENIFLFSTIVF